MSGVVVEVRVKEGHEIKEGRSCLWYVFLKRRDLGCFLIFFSSIVMSAMKVSYRFLMVSLVLISWVDGVCGYCAGLWPC